MNMYVRFFYYLPQCLGFVIETNCVLCELSAEAEKTAFKFETLFCLWYCTS